MLTYQDFEAASDVSSFLTKAIEMHRESPAYRRAQMARRYYEQKNDAILARMTYLQRMHTVSGAADVPWRGADSKIITHRLCSGFFPKFIKQLNQYLLGNGVTLPSEIKEKLGAGFDKTLQKAGMSALIDGVAWGYWDNGALAIYRSVEFIPLLDEQTSAIRAGIRFWQIEEKRPLYVELYEVDGRTEYISHNGEGLAMFAPKQAYQQRVFVSGLSEAPIAASNYTVIPVFPLYANELQQSELTDGIKTMIDAYDFINSDLVDGITLVEGIYWAVKNYGGVDIADLVQEIEQLRAVYTDGANAGADPHSLEIPYQAKQTALELLQQRLYEDFMALDLKSIQGGSLTNVAINVAKTDFDLKTDIFEWQCADFVQQILTLIGHPDELPVFKRRSITNDTEAVENIYTFRADIDHRTALEMNPLIADEKIEGILASFDAENAVGLPDMETLQAAIDAHNAPDA